MGSSYNRVSKIIPFILGALSFNFMFISADKTRWPGDLPQISVSVNAESFGYLPSKTVIINSKIRSASSVWLKEGGSVLSFEVNSGTNFLGNSGIESVTCNDAEKKLVDDSVKIYAEFRDDPDCTGMTCEFIWSCKNENKIVRADIQFNRLNEFIIADDDSELNLKTLTVHSLGHIAGLDHCRAGEKIDSCFARSNQALADPDVDSVMYKYPSSFHLSADDSAGIQFLYGKLSLPFPADGRYSLSDNDTQLISGLIGFVNSQIKTKDDWHTVIGTANQTVMTPVLSSDQIKDLVLDDFKNGTTNAMKQRIAIEDAIELEREKANSFVSAMRQKIPGYSNAMLFAFRRNLSAGLMMNTLVQKYNDGADPYPAEMLDISRDSLKSMRRSVIDEMIDRGLAE